MRKEILTFRLKLAIKAGEIDAVKNHLDKLIRAGADQHEMVGKAQAFLRKMDSSKGESHVKPG